MIEKEDFISRIRFIDHRIDNLIGHMNNAIREKKAVEYRYDETEFYKLAYHLKEAQKISSKLKLSVRDSKRYGH